MKKLLAAVLCLVLVGLCACGRRAMGETTTTDKTTQDTATNRYGQAVVDIKTDKKDPYSFVIKEHYDLFFDENIDPYVKHFFLYDIDGDGTKELLLGMETYSGIVLFAVYSIQDNIAARQEALTPWMEEFPFQRSLLKNGTIKIEGRDEVGPGYGYLRFEDGELRRQASLGIDYGEYVRIYTENGYERVPITKAEFDRLQKEMEGDGQVVDLDWKPLAEYGR